MQPNRKRLGTICDDETPQRGYCIGARMKATWNSAVTHMTATDELAHVGTGFSKSQSTLRKIAEMQLRWACQVDRTTLGYDSTAQFLQTYLVSYWIGKPITRIGVYGGERRTKGIGPSESSRDRASLLCPTNRTLHHRRKRAIKQHRCIHNAFLFVRAPGASADLRRAIYLAPLF